MQPFAKLLSTFVIIIRLLRGLRGLLVLFLYYNRANMTVRRSYTRIIVSYCYFMQSAENQLK